MERESMKIFGRKEERAEETKSDTDNVGADLLRALLSDEVLTRKEAMQIPAVNASIGRIARIVSSLPIKLYQDDGKETTDIKNRCALCVWKNHT